MKKITNTGTNADRIQRQSGRTKVLFVESCPGDVHRLRLDEEVREIDSALQRSRRRSRFGLHQKHAVRPKDVLQALLDIAPGIVHFSGHGSAEGLILEGLDGQSKTVGPNALRDFFEAFANEVECVVLNACYSATQAAAIGAHIDYVIGLVHKVTDRGAIAFAVAFYSALGAGRTIEQAYRIACASMLLLGGSEADRPILKIHPRLIRSTKKLAKKKWTLVLDAVIDDLDKVRVDAIVERLRRIAQDTSIELKELAAGSVVMSMEGSEDAFQVLRYLFAEGGLSAIEGLKLLDFGSGWNTTAALSRGLDSFVEGSKASGRAIRDLAAVLKNYLDGVGYLQMVTMGDDDQEPVVTVDENRRLSEALGRQIHANTRSITISVVVSCLIAAGAVAAPFAVSGKPTLLAALIAAALLSLVFTSQRLRGLWVQNNTIGICQRLLDELQAEAAAELINLLYWTILKKK